LLLRSGKRITVLRNFFVPCRLLAVTSAYPLDGDETPNKPFSEAAARSGDPPSTVQKETFVRFHLTLAVTAGLFLAVPVPMHADDSDVQAILDKAIEAHGGADKLTKFPAATVKGKGSVTVADQKIDFTQSNAVQFPGQFRFEAQIDASGATYTFLILVDGDKGWMQLPGQDIQEMDKEAITEMKEQVHALSVCRLAPLKDKAYTLSPLGEAKIGDKEAVGIHVTHKDHADVNLYFDRKSGLLLKMERRAKDSIDGNKEYTAEMFYSDYKEIDGVQHAMKETLKRDGKEYLTTEISELLHQEKLDASTFAKP